MRGIKSDEDKKQAIVFDIPSSVVQIISSIPSVFSMSGEVGIEEDWREHAKSLLDFHI